ncbi:ATP-binding protein [Simplicispira psychrophila]|uniref:ATP-binding protein n=1 Tax=Simplicispira psychrophila TaxID=80882 RepID=UPI000569D934|nr:ATP-binding protein [Simplicispira psychrophila]
MTARRPWLPRAPRSLRVRLLLFLLGTVLLSALLQGALAYRSALAEADVLFDYQMQQMALALRAGLPVNATGLAAEGRGEEGDPEFVVQVWSNEGLRIFESAFGTTLPQVAVLGFTKVHTHGQDYRVFSLQTRAQVIQVAQAMVVRQAMARTLAWRTMAPVALMVPLLVLAVWWVVGSSLAPVERVRRQLAQRRAPDLGPVMAEDLPDEVQPLVQELNLLFLRVQQAFVAQQNFVADAAHELRSPLAALKLQVQGLQRAADADTRHVAVARLSAGIDRAARLVEQLLELARHEASAAAGAPLHAVPLLEVVQWALADAAPAAQARQIDLGLGTADAASVPGQPEALRILLRNLLDNALKYTPPGGRVDVHLDAAPDAVTLAVEDSGPGIAPSERTRVLDRFYRVPDAPAAAGSGLGLAIVRSIAQQHGAALLLDASPQLGGLRVRLQFAPPSQPVPALPAAGAA